MRWRKTVTVVGLATLLALIWADRRETRRELRRLADRLDAQVTLPVPQRSAPVVSSVASAPAESDRASYPPYIIETPDLILIDPTRIAPLPLYQVEPLDVLHTAGKNVLAADPINDLFTVGPDGTVDLGPARRQGVRGPRRVSCDRPGRRVDG